MKGEEKADYEQVMSKYYGDDQVKSIIQLKVETKEADIIAEKVANLPEIQDLFLVTGDADLIAKVSFENYGLLKRFIVEKLSKIDGVRDTKTLMIVTTFKEDGKLKANEEKS
ncbi:MAG: Lrp/AsnC ligand binding domain-containing protein [Thermoplasmata archaeon]|nr:Lrp/AsnC ligand binding domain-containing protein [Thermoplasmata archaeon]